MGADLDSYFRAEARELCDGLLRGFLDLEKEPERPGLVAECFRLAHTLKGAARAVKKVRISEMAHIVEEALIPFRDGEAEVDAPLISDLLKIIEQIRAEVDKLEPQAAAPGQKSGAAVKPEGERLESVRVALRDLDSLLESLAEVTVRLGDLSSAVDTLGHAHRTANSLLEQLGGTSAGLVGAGGGLASSQAHGQKLTEDVVAYDSAFRGRLVAALQELATGLGHVQRELGGNLGRLEREMTQVQSRANDLRLLPVSAITSSLELALRDAAEVLGKRIEFQVSGTDLRVEGHVLPAVRDALLHMLRNAADHGIEAESVRLAAGKPALGRIHLRVERRGRLVAFRVEDDGRGIDAEAVRRAALARRMVSEAEAQAMSRDEVLHLIFRAGVSTSTAVSELSGRGVGLDVVRETAARYKGELAVSSEPGRGTALELTIPASISSLPSLVATAFEQTILLPLDAVRGTRRIAADEVFQRSDGTFVLYDGAAVPFVAIEQLLDAPPRPRSRFSLVMLSSGQQLLGLGVDRLVGIREVIIKPLPSCAASSTAVLGAALDAKGDPVLALDPRALANVVPSQPLASGPGRGASRLPILVIDDSLTTRMLEQSILESAGYTVELCASAEEGLAKAKERRYGLFIVDVEMPGMSGFEFTAATRADPLLREVPVILVTSLSSAAHRRRGAEAGAAAYIVKGEFDQKSFTRKVAELLR